MFLTAVLLWFRGITPALYRLGRGLARRKIAVFAKSSQSSLQALLVDSGLIRTRNLIAVTDDGDIGKAEEARLFLVYWPDWAGEIDRILALKKDSGALVVYCPAGDSPIPPGKFTMLNSHRNVIVCNFRGRLLNDIVTTMITTAHDKG
jgi:hypothetical protein